MKILMKLTTECINQIYEFLKKSFVFISGLFRRVILMSGSLFASWARVRDPLNYALQLGKYFNCTIPNDLTNDHNQVCYQARKFCFHFHICISDFMWYNNKTRPVSWQQHKCLKMLWKCTKIMRNCAKCYERVKNA